MRSSFNIVDNKMCGEHASKQHKHQIPDTKQKSTKGSELKWILFNLLNVFLLTYGFVGKSNILNF